MSMKPAIITAAQVSEQTNKLTKSVWELTLTVRQLEKRLAAIERSLAENDQLRATVLKMRDESLALFQAEWRKRKEFYPDIRLNIITKAAELLTPPKKDKDKGAAGGGDKPK